VKRRIQCRCSPRQIATHLWPEALAGFRDIGTVLKIVTQAGNWLPLYDAQHLCMSGAHSLEARRY